MPLNNLESASFLKSYLSDFSELLKPDKLIIEQLIEVAKLLNEAHCDGKKTLIFGNGGSAAIASHVSVDLTKNAKIRCVNYNEADLITCFANDYGFENWVERAVEFYGDEGDLLIVISSSGMSENILKGVTSARKKKFRAIITLSGFNENNNLRKMGDINLWIDSKAYNFVENIHQVWLLGIVDLIIGKREYTA